MNLWMCNTKIGAITMTKNISESMENKSSILDRGDNDIDEGKDKSLMKRIIILRIVIVQRMNYGRRRR